jgi:hypothetical protein
MTDFMTHTTLLGDATGFMTTGLLLGFLDAAWYGPAKPLSPLFTLFHVYCFSFLIFVLTLHDGGLSDCIIK